MKKFYYLIMILALVLVSCSGDDDNPSTPNKPTEEYTKFEVEYSPGVKFFDFADTVNIVKLNEKSNGNYELETKDNNKFKELKTGDLFVVAGKTLGEVKQITNNGNQTIIEFRKAKLNEVIKNGSIKYNYEVNFDRGFMPEAVFKGKAYNMIQIANNEFEVSIPYKGYTYTVSFKMEKDKADVTISAEKELAKGLKALYKAEGTISKFSTASELEYKNNKLTKFDNLNNDINGDLTLSATVLGSGSDLLNYELPIVLLKYPFMVGPIPVILNIKLMVVINSVVPVDGSSQVSVKFKYNSSTGVKFDGLKVSTQGNAGNYTMDKNIAQSGASSSIAMNFGIGFPRLELDMFGETVVPWIHTAFLIGGDYTMFPACQQARCSFIGACGVNLSFLGFEYSKTHNIWEYKKTLLKVGQCD